MENQAEQLVHADGTSGQGTASSAVPYRSPAERRAEGKSAARRGAPRGPERMETAQGAT